MALLEDAATRNTYVLTTHPRLDGIAIGQG